MFGYCGIPPGGMAPKMKQHENTPHATLRIDPGARVLLRRAVPILFAALCLLAYWLGGELSLLLAAMTMPFLVFGTSLFFSGGNPGDDPRLDRVTGALRAGGFEPAVQVVLDRAARNRMSTACFVIEIDAFGQFEQRHGQSVTDMVLRACADRITTAIRGSDCVARLGDARFAVCLDPVRLLDLQDCIQLAARIQSTMAVPLKFDRKPMHVSVSVGLALSEAVENPSASRLIAAAECALDEAMEEGFAKIRVYAPEMPSRAKERRQAEAQIAVALENGEITAWFQPQISTDTGRVSGFEALARWEHPDRGVLPPAAFLDTLERMGRLDRLSEVMLKSALTALKGWDCAGLDVPRVGVNFSQDELSNPALVERVCWELDRIELPPDRLIVEVLETVMSDTANEMISRNIKGLIDLGCTVDLDDFGTGHASIAAIRQFNASRLKIDRSFVTGADKDPDQQRMINAIVSLAERLGIETLAEGVETAGEHAYLAQLGCNHVQGFAIARPMPFSETIGWTESYMARVQVPPLIGRPRA